MSVRDAGRRKVLLKQARARAENAICFYPGCPYKAIGSHVLQERGVLDQIADKGIITEFAPLDFFVPSRFERASIGATNRLRFYGFCKDGHDHDGKLFSRIENSSCEFFLYKEQLLASYRALCNGFYQTIIFNTYNEIVLKDSVLSPRSKMSAMGSAADNMYAHKELEYFKNKVELELFGSVTEQSFIFYRYELPKLDIAASHMFAQSYRPNLNYEQDIQGPARLSTLATGQVALERRNISIPGKERSLRCCHHLSQERLTTQLFMHAR